MSKNNKNFFKKKNEWSKIKDKLLGVYLMPYFQKILKTGKPVIYVDCFAGKGKFDDGNFGSPLIAIEVINKCLEQSTAKSKEITPYFIELHHSDDLKKNLIDYGMEKNIVAGKYEEKIERILSDKKDANVFLYIDPYGIKALDSNLFDRFKLLGFNTFEMLINFNSFGFFRDACRALGVEYKNDKALMDLDDIVEYDPTVVDSSMRSIDLLTNIAGGDYWKSIVTDYKNKRINGFEAEKILSTKYKNQLKKKFKYVLDLPIRLKEEQRPKYRMIHVCNHEEGCFLMAQNMQKRKSEVFFNIQQKRNYTLFDFDDSIAIDSEGEILCQEQLEAMVKEQVTKSCKEPLSITSFMADFVNEHGIVCEFTMIYEILDKLNSIDFLIINRTPVMTKNLKPSKFWAESKDHALTIRRKEQ